MRVTLALLLLMAAMPACSVDAGVSRQLGARCDRKEDCAERCLTDSAGFPGGFCSASCLDDGDCTSAGVCADVEGGVCLFPCAADVDCAFLGAGPWRCRDRDGLPSGQVRVCLGD